MSDDTRTFHYADSASDKFWSIALQSTATVVQFGRLGTTGQRQVKEHGTADAARAAYDRLMDEKVKKGYVETVAGGGPAKQDADAPASTKESGAMAARSDASTLAENAMATITAPIDATPDATAVESMSVAPASAVLEPTRTIALDSRDWFRATWHRLAPLERTDPVPFDLLDATMRLSKLRMRQWRWDWTTAGIAPSLTREEAAFWFTAIIGADYNVDPQERARRLASEGFDRDLTLDKVAVALESHFHHGVLAPEIMPLLSNLLPWGDVVTLLFMAPLVERLSWPQIPTGVVPTVYMMPIPLPPGLIQGFVRYVLPYTREEDVETLRQRLSAEIDLSVWPTGTTPLNRGHATASIAGGLARARPALAARARPRSSVWCGRGAPSIGRTR